MVLLIVVSLHGNLRISLRLTYYYLVKLGLIGNNYTLSHECSFLPRESKLNQEYKYPQPSFLFFFFFLQLLLVGLPGYKPGLRAGPCLFLRVEFPLFEEQFLEPIFFFSSIESAVWLFWRKRRVSSY